MADGEHSLPPNEELFEQPMEQEPQQFELPRGDEHPQDQGYHGVPEDPQASGGAPPHDMEHHYPAQEDPMANSHYYEPPPPPPTNQVFQPTPQQNFVAPQPRDAQNYEEQGAGDAGGGGAAENGEDPPGDAETVWIDSDSDDDPEAEFLRANFGLTYCDHNYDCPNPEDRVIHPQEGPFKVIGGLSEDGRIVKEWMPDGYGPPHREGYVPTEEDEEQQDPATVKEEPLQQQHHQEYQSPPLQQQQVHPMRQNVRPVVAAQPFSIGGNQVEYAEPRMPPRGVSVAPRDTQFRIINELGHPMMAASSQQHHGIRAQSVSSSRVLNNSPHATIIRQQPQNMYQAPQGSLRGTPLQSQQQRLGGATPGSYQHIVNPSPSGNFGATIRRQVPAQGAPRGVGGPGIVVSNQLGPRPGVRPVHVTRPMTDNLDRDFIEHPMPLPPQGPPIRRAPADVAPHRMTAEQRLEQQQLNRQRTAQFPLQRDGVQPQQQPTRVGLPTQQAAIIGRGRPGAGVMAVGSPGHEDLLRSPQRGIPPIQDRQPVVLEPRKFQVRVTDTYSAPIPKASDQLPAQLTEDPPEEVQKVEEPTEEAPETSGNEVKQEIKSPSRLTSATSSPVKSHHGIQKPTPPHRMTQEEKNAHLAKLSTDKEKPTNLNTLPLRGVHHQDDTLAVVQSVFESNKPRQPDTPKDKEAISKIADLLRFSADEFTGASGSGTGTSNTNRQRSISGGANRAQNYGPAPMVQTIHQPHLHHQQPNPMDDETRRKRQGSGRYDNNMGMSPMHQMRSPQHPAHIQQQQEQEPNLDPPQRPRGRPRGATSAQQRVARFGNAPETLAPHRGAGGARTLPPRQVQQQQQELPAPPPRAAMSANSDSESEAVDSESWEMRCHCEMEHGDGETVECESCKTWQHMACMGLNMNSDTTKYKCEQCQPRRLPVTKAEAIRTQKKILEKLRRATERERRNKRKSEPVEPVKPIVQQSRKSAPLPLQPQSPPSHRIPQLNEYSRQATALLTSMQQTAGADQLLEESRRHNKARRMFVEENVEALVTMELVQIRQVILEVNGYVAMSNEMKRQPGGGNCIFMYDGLMKGTAGEDMGSGQELVCIDTKKKGNDTKFTRRSCIPNCVLKHVLGSQATLGIMVVATKDILRNTEVTLPFDADWKESDVPLECAEHMRDIHSCPFEQERRRAAGDRQRVKDTEKRRIEEAKRADEERRRLEEEVRRERAAKTKQLEEEAEKERLEQERAEKERKAKEREEAKKKREAEKKKEQAESGSSSKQPEGITSRDALRVQQAEERFRRQEEEEKRREARRSRSKSQTPKPEDVPTSSDAPSTSDSQASRRQSSRNQQKKETAAAVEKVETPEVKEAPAAEDTPTTSGTRSSRRMKTPAAIVVAASAANSGAKKPRYSTAVRVEPTTTISPSPIVSRKRGATASSLTPAAKRANSERPEPPMYRLGDLAQELNENAAGNSMVLEFEPPEGCMNESTCSGWAKEAKEAVKAKKAAKSSSSSSTSKPVEPPAKKAATPVAKKKEVAAPPVVESSRRRGEVKEAPKTVEIAEKAKKEDAPEDKNVAGPAPPPPAASPKKSAPKAVEKPEKPSEIHGMEREASDSAEGSVEKELTPTTPSAAKKAPKKLSVADYAARRSKRDEPGTSAASAPSPSSASTSTRRGFIPSTDGLGGNVQLSAIPLDNHPANASITTTAPSLVSQQPPPPPPPANPTVSITSPSTRSRARAAASESADETPAEHQMSLTDRIAHMFGGGIVAAPTAAAAAPPPPPPQSSNDTSNSSRPRTRPTRWNV